MTITFFVHGLPKPAGSKTAMRNKYTGRVVVIDACKTTKPWQDSVRSAAIEAWQGRPLLIGPVELTLLFFFPRPKCHHVSDDYAKPIRDKAPKWHLQTPDALKAARAIEDAMTHHVYHDDCQIVDEHLYKRWTTTTPGVSITVTELE